MNENVYAVAVGYRFGFIPSNDLKDIKIKTAGAVRFEGENWNLYKATSFDDSRKIDTLLDQYGDFSIKDYKIEPVVMSGEIEMVIPGFQKERDSLLFGGYSFVCADKEIPVDFSGTAWDIQQEGANVLVSFATGRTPFATDYFLDSCYEADYNNAGLRINDITAEFLSKASVISEFTVFLERNGEELSTEDIAKNGRFAIKSLCFANGFANKTKEFPVKQDVLDAFNSSLNKEVKPSLYSQIQSASSRVSDSHPIEKAPTKGPAPERKTRRE